MLTGSYHPRTDHLRFNRRIPDEFPFIDYAAATAGQVSDHAVLVEEFLHRCQWAGTPFGLVFRQAALAQVRESIRILRHVAADRAVRLPTPWFDGTADPDPRLPPAVRTGLDRMRSIEILQRFLLGVPLGGPLGMIHRAVDIGRDALTELTPLRFGTFQSWGNDKPGYQADGTPVLNRSTRGIMESHASAYAAELLRAASPPSSHRLIDEHVRRNRVGLYRALEELAEAADVPVPALRPRHVLDLADVAIGVQVSDIPGLPPPPDYVDSMLPYIRYQTALSDLHGGSQAMRFIADHEPDRLAAFDDSQRLDLVVQHAVLLRGQASPLWNQEFAPGPRRASMEQNVRSVWAWSHQQEVDSDGPVGIIEHMVLDAIGYTSIRFFKIYAETNTDTVLFTPQVDRFVFLARYCDWPVIEYADGQPVVFLCDPMPDPGPVARQSLTVYEVTKLFRRLFLERCGDFRGPDWNLTLWEAPVVDVFGVAPEQLAP